MVLHIESLVAQKDKEIRINFKTILKIAECSNCGGKKWKVKIIKNSIGIVRKVDDRIVIVIINGFFLVNDEGHALHKTNEQTTTRSRW